MNSMKRQKDMIPEDESSRLEGLQYATGEEWRAIAERMKHLGRRRNDAQLWKCLLVEAKSSAKKNNIA